MTNDFMRGGRWGTVGSLLMVMSVAMLAGSLVTAMIGHASSGARTAVPLLVASANAVPAGQVSFDAGFSAVTLKVQPAVVSIVSTKLTRSRDPGFNSPFSSDPLFGQFFGDEFGPLFPGPRQRRERGLGSGVIVNPDGYLLTNNHVVEGADDIRVSLRDKREFKARIIGTDPKTDIAVLKVDVRNLPAVVLGDSSKVKVGQFALAVGNPFAIGQTVTMGIVSATGRGGLGIEDYEDFIQTDAAINPGNSGGALVDVHGDLIGINTAILAGEGRGNQGVGFAVPINMAQQVMQQILQNGKVIRGWLGVTVQPVDATIARAFDLKDPHGALISDVTASSPAEHAGLQKGDIVLTLDGTPIEDSRDLSLTIAVHAPDSAVKLKVFRNGSVRDIQVKLGEMPSKEERASAESSSTGEALEGLSVGELTPSVARQLGLSAGTRGVVVSGVQPGSLPADVGLRRGDVIQEVNRKPVVSVAEFDKALGQTRNLPVLLLVNRGGRTLYVAVEDR